MSIEQAIHDRWRTYKPLAELVPDDRFFTGTAPQDGDSTQTVRPYVTLDRLPGATVTRTSGGRQLIAQRFRFNIWADSLDEGRKIAARAAARFARADFRRKDVVIQDMLLLEQTDLEQDDGTWLTRVDYLVRAETKSSTT